MLMEVGSLIEQFRFDTMKPIYDVTIGKAMHKTELFEHFGKKANISIVALGFS